MAVEPRRFRLVSLDFDLAADGAVGEHLRTWLSPFALEGRGAHELGIRQCADGSLLVTWDGDVALRPADEVEALSMCVWWLNQRVVSTPTDALLVHASVAGTLTGSVLFPGASGSGKSTLIAALVRSGLSYLSDELGIIALDTGHVCPYPRLITLERDVWRHFPEVEGCRVLLPGLDQWFVPVHCIRDGALREGPAGVRALIFPNISSEGRTRLTPISHAEALTRLCRFTFNLSAHGRAGFHTLARLVRETGQCYELRADSVESAVRVVRSVVG